MGDNASLSELLSRTVLQRSQFISGRADNSHDEDENFRKYMSPFQINLADGALRASLAENLVRATGVCWSIPSDGRIPLSFVPLDYIAGTVQYDFNYEGAQQVIEKLQNLAEFDKGLFNEYCEFRILDIDPWHPETRPIYRLNAEPNVDTNLRAVDVLDARMARMVQMKHSL
jgi:hypothetical protein